MPHSLRIGAWRLAVLAVMTACLIALLCAPRAAAATPVYVFPIPGSHVAPPHAQIVFRGISVARIGRFTVTGSRSGMHTGTLRGDSDGRGGSFIPSSAFTPGEWVTVSTHLNIEGRNTSTWKFHVATPGPSLLIVPLVTVLLSFAGTLVFTRLLRGVV